MYKGKEIRVKEVFGVLSLFNKLNEIKETKKVKNIQSFRTAHKNDDGFFRPLVNTESTMFYGWILEHFNMEYVLEKEKLENITPVDFEGEQEYYVRKQFENAMRNAYITDKLESDDLNKDVSEEKEYLEIIQDEKNYKQWTDNNRTFSVPTQDARGYNKEGKQFNYDFKNQNGIALSNYADNGKNERVSGMTVKHSPSHNISRLEKRLRMDEIENSESFFSLFNYVLEDNQLITANIPVQRYIDFYKSLDEHLINKKGQYFNIPNEYKSNQDIHNAIDKLDKNSKENEEKIKEVFTNFEEENIFRNDMFDKMRENNERLGAFINKCLTKTEDYPDVNILIKFLKENDKLNYLIEFNELNSKIDSNIKEIGQLEEYLDNGRQILQRLEIEDFEFGDEKFRIFMNFDNTVKLNTRDKSVEYAIRQINKLENLVLQNIKNKKFEDFVFRCSVFNTTISFKDKERKSIDEVQKEIKEVINVLRDSLVQDRSKTKKHNLNTITVDYKNKIEKIQKINNPSTFDALEKAKVLTIRITPNEKGGFLKAMGEEYIIDSTLDESKDKKVKETKSKTQNL